MGRILSKLACLALTAAILAAAVGLAILDLPASVKALRTGQRETERLDQECRAAGQRNAAKYAAACRLADGQLTLLAAAARFRDIDASAPERQQQRPAYLVRAELRRTGSPEEDSCREALVWAEDGAADAPDAVQDRLRALRHEFNDRLSRGDLRLPPAAPAEAG